MREREREREGRERERERERGREREREFADEERVMGTVGVPAMEAAQKR
jgi:hypothetical protein